MPSPEEVKAEAEAKAKADAERVKAEVEAKAKADAEKAADEKLSLEDLRARLAETKREAIDRRHETKAEKEKRETAEKELATLRTEKAERDRKELETQGKFKELAEKEATERIKLQSEIETLRTKASAYEASLKDQETALRSEIGDAAKDLDLDALPLETRISTLRSIAKIARGKTESVAPKIEGIPANRGGPSPESAKKEEQRTAILNDRKLSYVQKAAALRKLLA